MSVIRAKCGYRSEYDCDDADNCAYDKRAGKCTDVEEIVSKGEEELDKPIEEKEKREILQDMMSTSYEYNLFKSLKLWRERCTEIVQRNNCELGTWINNLFVYESGKEKQSASSTIIIKGLLSPTKREIEKKEDSNIIIKVSFESLNKFNNSLNVEQAIYKNVIPNLVLNMHTPGVVYALGTLDCEAITSLPPEQLDKYDLELGKIGFPMRKGRFYPPSYDINKPSLLVMEKSKGITLSDWFKTPRKQEDILSIIFIAVYTLNCFANIGLRHNDLHFGNIFVEDLRTYAHLYFKVEDDKIIKVKTRYIPKIYDFDRGSILSPLVPRNIMLDISYCQNVGTCNTYSPKYDLYTFMALIAVHIGKNMKVMDMSGGNTEPLSEIIKVLISKCVNKEWLQQRFEENEQYPHLLPYNISPTDAELASHAKTLEVLYTSNWENKGLFTVLRPPDTIPKVLLYSLPEKKVMKYEMVNQVNKTDTPIPFSESFIDSIDEEKELDRILVLLADIWVWDVKSVTGDNLKSIMRELYLDISSKNPKINDKTLFFLFVCKILCCYQYYSLSLEDRRKIFGPTITTAIGGVWSMIGNILPVKIPILYLE